jgi:hypothetical protein
MTGGSFGGMGMHGTGIRQFNPNSNSNKTDYLNGSGSLTGITKNASSYIKPNTGEKHNIIPNIGPNNLKEISGNHYNNHKSNKYHTHNHHNRNHHNYGSYGSYGNSWDPWWWDYSYYYPYAPMYSPLLVNYPDYYTFPFIKETDVINNENENLIDDDPYGKNLNDNNASFIKVETTENFSNLINCKDYEIFILIGLILILYVLVKK